MRIVVLLCAGLSACSSMPQGNYYRVSDGVRGDATPDVFAQFTQDKTVCQGETAKARMAMNPEAWGQITAEEQVMRGCMAQRGYVVR